MGRGAPLTRFPALCTYIRTNKKINLNNRFVESLQVNTLPTVARFVPVVELSSGGPFRPATMKSLLATSTESASSTAKHAKAANSADSQNAFRLAIDFVTRYN